MRRRIVRKTEAGFLAAQQADQLVLDNLDDLLGGREGGQDLLPERFFADIGDQLFDDLEIDVGLEQRHPNLLERVLDILLGELALAAKVLEDTLKLVR